MFSNLLFKSLKKTAPSVSETELTALKAGDSSLERSVFQGSIDWNSALKIKHPKLTKEEALFLENEVVQLCEMANDFVINDQKNDLPDEVWTFLKEKGFFGLIIQKEFGGKEFSPYANSVIVSTIATKCITAAITTMVPNSLGCGELLQHYGTKEQKELYLPRLADGREIPCFALTSPEAGSDATSIPDEGIICHGEFDGEKILGISLSWDKRYITLAPVATLIGLAFKCKDPDGLLSEKIDRGITCAIVPSDLVGVFNNKKHIPMGMSFMNGPTSGQSVFIPLSYVIGGEEYIGAGWKMLVECLSAGRGISLPALGAATNQVTYKTSIQYAKVRKQFGTEIFNFQGIKEPLIRIATNNLITESFRKLVLTDLNNGISPTILSAMAKYHMTEMARESINHAMDIHGGKAIQCGTDNYLNYAYRGIPVAITVEGANILTRSLMIFGQGSVRCHPYLLSELAALTNANEKDGAKQFKKAFNSHIKYATKKYLNAIKVKIFGSSAKVNSPLKKYIKEIDRISVGYAVVADLLLLSTGGDIKRHEHLSARLGDLLSYLTLAIAVIVQYQNDNVRHSIEPLYKASILDLLQKINSTIDELHSNTKSVIIRKHIKLFLRPSKLVSSFDDNFKNNVLKNLNGNERSLTHLVHTNRDFSCGIGTLDRAFATKEKCKPLYARLKKEVRDGNLPSLVSTRELILMATEKSIITESDAELLRKSESLIRRTISVQSFPIIDIKD